MSATRETLVPGRRRRLRRLMGNSRTSCRFLFAHKQRSRVYSLGAPRQIEFGLRFSWLTDLWSERYDREMKETVTSKNSGRKDTDLECYFDSFKTQSLRVVGTPRSPSVLQVLRLRASSSDASGCNTASYEFISLVRNKEAEGSNPFSSTRFKRLIQLSRIAKVDAGLGVE